MLDSLITSRTRIKLLLKFFLNPDMSGYLRQLAKEFDESTNAIRVELNKLTEAKMLIVETKGRNKLYHANESHPLFQDIRNIVIKSTGIDKVITNILNKMGDLDLAFIRGNYAAGRDKGLIDLVIIGENINNAELERVKLKTENLINRKIAVLVLNPNEFKNLKDHFSKETCLILLKKVKVLHEN